MATEFRNIELLSSDEINELIIKNENKLKELRCQALDGSTPIYLIRSNLEKLYEQRDILKAQSVGSNLGSTSSEAPYQPEESNLDDVKKTKFQTRLESSSNENVPFGPYRDNEESVVIDVEEQNNPPSYENVPPPPFEETDSNSASRPVTLTIESNRFIIIAKNRTNSYIWIRLSIMLICFIIAFIISIVGKNLTSETTYSNPSNYDLNLIRNFNNDESIKNLNSVLDNTKHTDLDYLNNLMAKNGNMGNFANEDDYINNKNTETDNIKNWNIKNNDVNSYTKTNPYNDRDTEYDDVDDYTSYGNSDNY